MITQDLGIATAYGYAKSKGYTGTEAEFAELMASYASTAQTAIEAADRAVEANTAAQSAKTDAAASKTAAQTAAQTATEKASEAVTAAGTATTKASEASQSASAASNAATSASTSAQTATTAAATATTKASEASESAATATTAKTDAESARDAAAQSANEAAASAESIDPDEFDRKIYAAFATDTASGSIASFADGADDIPMKDVVVHIDPVQAGSGDPSPDNVRPISGWTGCVISHSGADMTNPTTYSITFPAEAGTVYGGTLDVTSGVLTVDRAMVDLGTPNWILSTSQSSIGGTVFQIPISTIGMAKRYRNTPNTMLSSVFATAPTERWFISNMLDNEVFSNEISVYFSASQYSDVNAFKAAMSGVQLCYELATPITYTLTPQEITSLLGTNNLWADTGDCEVEYRANTVLWVQRKITEAVAAVLNS